MELGDILGLESCGVVWLDGDSKGAETPEDGEGARERHREIPIPVWGGCPTLL